LNSSGAPGKIRTLGQRLRRPLLYPTELLALVEGSVYLNGGSRSSP
jgi:hypothetical protein